jgi:hypothetical protein
MNQVSKTFNGIVFNFKVFEKLNTNLNLCIIFYHVDIISH